MAIIAIVFTAILPQFRAIQKSWDSKQNSAEILQNGRVLIDHLNRNLSKAVKITAVSDSSQINGYIEFQDNDVNNVRYDVNSTSDYVEFGPIGSLSDLAGPVSKLQFTCYDGNDFDTAITDVNFIRFVKVQTTLTNPAAIGRNRIFTTTMYLRARPNSGDAAIVAWWKLDETSGLIAADSSGNGNDGTLTNMFGDEWTTGQVDGALEFDGADDNIDCGNDDSLNITDEITLSAWINMVQRPDRDNWYTITWKENAYSMYLYGTDSTVTTLGADFWLDTGRADIWSGPDIDIPPNDWAHVAVTFDGTEFKFYVNGEHDYTEDEPGTIEISTINFLFNEAGSIFKGLMDDVRVYNYALSGEEIAQLADVLTFQQFTEAKAGTDTTSITISTPADTNESDLLIAAVVTDGDTDLSLSPLLGEGWTEISLKDYGSEVTLGAWWKNADAAESPSHQFTWSGNQQAYGWIMRFTGHDTTDPINNSMADGENSSNPTSPSVTTTADGCLILRLGGFDDGDITVDDPGLSGHTVITMDSSSAIGATFEEFTEKKEAAGGTSLTIVTPAGTGEGDLLIAAVATEADTSSSLAPPGGEGWNEINIGQQGGRVTLGVWWKLADASESPSHQFTWGVSKQAYGWIMRFTGHDTSSTIDDTAVGGGQSGTPVSPAVTTTVANATILRIGGFKDDGITVDAPGLSGHIAITMDYSISGGKCSGGAGYVTQAAIGSSGTSNFSLTASKEYRAVTIAIVPAPVTGGVMVSGGAGYVKQATSGISGTSSFSLTASQESRVVTLAITPNSDGGGGGGLLP